MIHMLCLAPTATPVHAHAVEIRADDLARTFPQALLKGA